MKHIKTKMCILIIGVLFSFQVVAASFEVWSERTGLFTVGKPSRINIYAQNLGTGTDGYSVSVTRKEATYQTQDVSHLLSVSIPSNRIESVQPNEVSSTFATLKILGPIDNGIVEFTVTSDSGGSEQTSIEITEAGLPISLPEFKFIGLIQLLFFASLFLIISNTSHLS